MKPVGNPKSYRPITLLGVLYRILEKLKYTHVKLIIDILLPKSRLDFDAESQRRIKVILLLQTIDDFFEAKKAGVVFVNRTAVYDTSSIH